MFFKTKDVSSVKFTQLTENEGGFKTVKKGLKPSLEKYNNKTNVANAYINKFSVLNDADNFECEHIEEKEKRINKKVNKLRKKEEKK